MWPKAEVGVPVQQQQGRTNCWINSPQLLPQDWLPSPCCLPRGLFQRTGSPGDIFFLGKADTQLLLLPLTKYSVFSCYPLTSLLPHSVL